MHELEFDAKRHLVGVRSAGVVIDLGGLGKGYAVDQLVALLRDWSIPAGLVHAGLSTVYALGAPPGAAAWSVALRDPDAQDQALGRIALRDAALSGSGRALHGNHIIDPRRGVPAVGHAAAWARAPSAALADGLSTAFMVMSPAAVAGYARRSPGRGAILAPRSPQQRRLLCLGIEIG